MYSSLSCSKLFYKTFILVLLVTPKSCYFPVLEHNKAPKTQAVLLLLQPVKALQGAKKEKDLPASVPPCNSPVGFPIVVMMSPAGLAFCINSCRAEGCIRVPSHSCRSS